MPSARLQFAFYAPSERPRYAFMGPATTLRPRYAFYAPSVRLLFARVAPSARPDRRCAFYVPALRLLCAFCRAVRESTTAAEGDLEAVVPSVRPPIAFYAPSGGPVRGHE